MNLVKPVLLPFAVTIAGCTVLAAVLGGAAAAWGALLGGLLVGLFLGSSPVIVGSVARRSAALSVPVALGLFAAKAVAAALLVMVFLNVAGIAERIDRQALGLTAVALALLWTALQVKAFLTDRTPTYDLPDES